MSEVRCPPPGKRTPYLLRFAVELEKWVWACPVCEFRFELDAEEEAEAKTLADAHECEAGWCPVPAPGWSPPGAVIGHPDAPAGEPVIPFESLDPPPLTVVDVGPQDAPLEVEPPAKPAQIGFEF